MNVNPNKELSHLPNSEGVPPDVKFNEYLKDIFEQKKTQCSGSSLLPYSLKEVVGVPYEAADKMVWKIFRAIITPAPDDVYFPHTLKNLILPLLYERNLLLQRPTSEDTSRILKKFNMLEYNVDLPSITSQNGINLIRSPYEEDNITQCAMIIKNSKSSKAYGAVQYFFKRGNCHLESITAHRKYKKMKYGSLLLGAAILDAKAKDISTITLQSTRDALGFYISFGFVPEKFSRSIKFQMWQSLSTEEKILEAQEIGHLVHMKLDLIHSQEYEQQIFKAIYMA